MRPNPNTLLLQKLNRRRLMQFKLHGDTFIADYFSWELFIQGFINGYMVVAVRGCETEVLMTKDQRTLLTFHEVAEQLTIFRHKHPFTICIHSRGRHQLLDPDGFDHCGEYVTLKGARRTSEVFFQMGA